MNGCSSLLWAAALVCAGAAGAQTGFPFQDETLRYSVNWPSGLSLGDVTLTAHRSSSGWDLEMTLDAGIPGFRVTDRFHSLANADLCSQQFERDTRHGAKKIADQTTFDYGNRLAHRLRNGEKSDLPLPSACAWDALAFVYLARRGLGQGIVTPPARVFFGSAVSVRMEYTGAQTIQVADHPEIADHVVVTLKGPSADTHFEIFFARDAARTPLSVRVPFAVGTLSMELAR